MYYLETDSMWQYHPLKYRILFILPILTWVFLSHAIILCGATLLLVVAFASIGIAAGTEGQAEGPKSKTVTAAATPTPTPSVATEMSSADTVQSKEASLREIDGETEPVDPPVSAKILRYVDRLVRRYDTSRDSKLQQSEWKAMHGEPRLVDLDGDGVITLEEMAHWVARYGYRRKIRLIPMSPEVATPSPTLLQPITPAVPDKKAGESKPAAEPPAAKPTPNATDQAPPKNDFRPGQRFYVSPRHRVQGLPGWFVNRDANGDQQLSMAEFAAKALQTDMKGFGYYDANGDGVITAKECAGKTPSPAPAPPTAKSEQGAGR